MTTGAGAFGAGAGSGGFDPVLDASDSNASTAPSALLFDPNTRDFRLGADGRFVAVHPVDQWVALQLWLRKGSVGSVPGAGCDLRNLSRQGGQGYVASIQDMVRLSLKTMIDNGSIRVIGIAVQTPSRGQTFVQVTYVNLKLASPQAPVTVAAIM
jgi:hypothetical protein